MAIDTNNIPHDNRLGSFMLLIWEMPNGKVAVNIPLGILYGEDGDPDLISEDVVQHYIDEYNQETVNLDSLEYLRSTDWYVIREQGGVTVTPDDVNTARQEARDVIIRTEYSKL